MFPHQLFYNYLYGRPFQITTFPPENSLDIGYSYNPYSYLHIDAIHVYLTPFLFAHLWSIWPNLPWLYGVVFLANYCGMALFAWKTLKYLSPHSYRIKAIAAVALLLLSGFLFTFQQYAQLLMFSGPFIMAAYYYLLTRRIGPFLASMLLLCFTSEDAAMVSVTFSFYIFLFERDVRKYAYISGILAIIHISVALLIIQPAARSHLTLTSATTATLIIKEVLNFDASNISLILLGLSPALFFFPAFGVVCLLFGKPKVSWLQITGLVLIAPLPHWGESVVVGATHHLMPVVTFLFVALVLVLGQTPDPQTQVLTLSKKRVALLFGLSAIFLAGNFRVMISNLPDELRLPLLRLGGKLETADTIEKNFLERRGNRRIIDVVEKIPKENSLVFLTNTRVVGFIAGRSDLWRFPFNFDLADYLIIQPNARQSYFILPKNIRDLVLGDETATSNNAFISEEIVNTIVQYLVSEKRSHQVVLQEPDVVLLKRIDKHLIYMPPSTTGFGWFKNRHSNGKIPEVSN